MFVTNLKIVIVVVLTLAGYTLIANMIPQIESEVPEELDLSGDVSAEQLVAAGERLYNGAGGCTACHGLGTRAPNLLTSEGGLGTIGARCGERSVPRGHDHGQARETSKIMKDQRLASAVLARIRFAAVATRRNSPPLIPPPVAAGEAE